MFIGSCYALAASAKGQTILGYSHLQIMERVLSRTKTRYNCRFKTTAYYYTLLCKVGGDSYDEEDLIGQAEIDEDELRSEIISGYYELVPEWLL